MYSIVLTTTDHEDVAKVISDKIISKRLSPCVQIIPGIKSSFIWKNKIENSSEILIQVKTKDSNIKIIKDIIEKYHNYKVPEIISFEINILNNSYKEWFNNNITIKE